MAGIKLAKQDYYSTDIEENGHKLNVDTIFVCREAGTHLETRE